MARGQSAPHTCLFAGAGSPSPPLCGGRTPLHFAIAPVPPPFRQCGNPPNSHNSPTPVRSRSVDTTRVTGLTPRRHPSGASVGHNAHMRARTYSRAVSTHHVYMRRHTLSGGGGGALAGTVPVAATLPPSLLSLLSHTRTAASGRGQCRVGVTSGPLTDGGQPEGCGTRRIPRAVGEGPGPPYPVHPPALRHAVGRSIFSRQVPVPRLLPRLPPCFQRCARAIKRTS